MNRRFLLVLLILVGLAVLLGPRPAVVEPVAVKAAPPALAAIPAWLAEREARAGVADTGVAKRVTFADSVPQRTPYVVVYLHGFSATRQETAPLAEEVARALRANLFETRLRGHGLPGDSMGVARAGDWLDDAVEALEVASQLGDSLVIIGTSTGGTLATWLATHPTYGARVHRLVLISPNFGVADGTAEWLTAPWAEPVLSRLLPWREWTARTPEQGRYWTTRYPSAALFPMQALVEVVRDKPLAEYGVPTLLFVHANDQVVDATRTAAWVARLRAAAPSTPVREVPVVPRDGEDGHVVVGRILAPSRVEGFREEIVRFVR
jgi:alpha-beta hydrolase superfamily lysophospholipase